MTVGQRALSIACGKPYLTPNQQVIRRFVSPSTRPENPCYVSAWKPPPGFIASCDPPAVQRNRTAEAIKT